MKDIIPGANDLERPDVTQALEKFARIMSDMKGREFTIRFFDDDLKERQKYDFTGQIWFVFLVMAGEVGQLTRLLSKSTQHAWGIVLGYGTLREACGAIRLRISEDKSFGIDDGISWKEGQTTRAILESFTGTIFDFGLSQDEFVILDYNNNLVCGCDSCQKLPQTKKAKKRFKEAWARHHIT